MLLINLFMAHGSATAGMGKDNLHLSKVNSITPYYESHASLRYSIC